MARSTEQVYHDHIHALATGDFPALMADYADDAVLMTMDGANVGKAAIGAYFINGLAQLPHFRLTSTQAQTVGDVVLMTWTADSDVAAIPNGVDTFLIHDDKIVSQTVWMTVAPK